MTTAALPYVIGTPGARAAITAEFRRVLANTSPMFFPGNRWISGVKSRDVGNYPYTECLRAGLMMGPLTATPTIYASSVIDTVVSGATQGSTSITISAAGAVELVRRIGASGTFTLTGPPAASGVVRSATVTYSAVNTTTGAITATAVGANQVEQFRFGTAGTAGNLQLQIQKPDGTYAVTGNIAWSATDATYLASANTALDTATGVVGGIVATAISAVDTDFGMVLTYSGTGYAGKSWTPAVVALLPTGNTAPVYTAVTAATSGAFIAGSYVGDTDGSQVPTLIIPDGPARQTTDLANPLGVSPIEFPQIPVASVILTAYLINYPTDSSMKTYVRQSLSTLVGPKFIFDDAF